MKYLLEIDKIINTYNIDKTTNIDTTLTKIGYVNFFNELTILCIGNPPHKHNNDDYSSGSLIYLPDETKNKLIMSVDILYISNLYTGVISNGIMEYNYDNYTSFISDLVNLRSTLKKQDRSNINDVRISIIKYYINLIYGMLNKGESVLTSSLKNPRDVISNTAKEAILQLGAYFLHKSKPIYYMDVDSIYVPHLELNELENINLYFQNIMGDKINHNITKIIIDDDECDLSGYIIGKKSMFMTQGRIKYHGLSIADDDKILLENKRYFGSKYKELFPEYAIW